MTNVKQIITRGIAILMLCGIVLFVGYGLYGTYRDYDKPVPEVAKTDSIGRLFEINGLKYYLRNDALYDEKGNMVADLSVDNNRSGKNAQVSPSLREVLNEGLGGEKESFDDYSIFGYGKEEAQRLYIQSVINSLASGKTTKQENELSVPHHTDHSRPSASVGQAGHP